MRSWGLPIPKQTLSGGGLQTRGYRSGADQAGPHPIGRGNSSSSSHVAFPNPPARGRSALDQAGLAAWLKSPADLKSGFAAALGEPRAGSWPAAQTPLPTVVDAVLTGSLARPG